MSFSLLVPPLSKSSPILRLEETPSGARGMILLSLANGILNMIFFRYALYSSLSPGFQKYLEGLSAVHSGVAQAEGNRAAGLPVRRKEVENIHPIVRVHPVTGWKSVYVNPGKAYSSNHIPFLTFVFPPKVSPAASWTSPKPNRIPFCSFCSARSAKIPTSKFGSNGRPTQSPSGTTGLVLLPLLDLLPFR